MTSACPCCEGDTKSGVELSRDHIRRSLHELMPRAHAPPTGFGDYCLRVCMECGLEFADPMEEPSPEFYEWLDDHGDYYPATRWEWEEAVRALSGILQHGDGRVPKVVDVGCGTGRFLALLRTAGFFPVGVDVSAAAVVHCREQGFEAVEGELGAIMDRLPNGIQAITLWHVVEHVKNPFAVLETAREIVGPGGVVMFSVPLCPPSYEANWRDPLNSPPHHLTRWTVGSLQALSKRLGMRLRLVFPDPESMWRRSFRSLVLQSSSPYAGLTRVRKLGRLLAYVLLHPWKPFVEVWCQARRPQFQGRVLPDVVLVCLDRQ